MGGAGMLARSQANKAGVKLKWVGQGCYRKRRITGLKERAARSDQHMHRVHTELNATGCRDSESICARWVECRYGCWYLGAQLAPLP
jgi:hypothetical protein